MFQKILIVIILLTIAVSASAEARESKVSEGRYKIHVLTMGQGDELFTRFGHIALMVDDKEKKTRKVYNFGTFDFSDPDLRLRYARGFLNYWLSVASYQDIVRAYKYYDREAVVRTLALTPKQASEINRRLRINAKPENRVYAYRHYIDNCCTRIRDLLDEVTDGALSKGRNTKHTQRTFRYWTDHALQGLPLYKTIILYSLGPAIDRPLTRWDEYFLPEVLAEDLDNTMVGPSNLPLVENKTVIIKRTGPAIGSETPDVDIYVIATLVLVLLVSLFLPIFLGQKKAAARAAGLGLLFWGLIAGLGGLMLVLYWTITTHFDTHYNENLLVNPVLHLWLVGPALKLIFKGRLGERTARFLGYYLLASIGLILVDMALKLGPFIQGNWGVVATALFCNAAGIFVLRRVGVLPALNLGKFSI